MTRQEAYTQLLVGINVNNWTDLYEYKIPNQIFRLTNKHIHKNWIICDFLNTEPANNYT